MNNTLAILLSDTYKQIHNKIYPKGLTKLVSYWTPRRSMLKNQNKMVFFGLQAFIEEYLVDYFNENFFELTAVEVEHTYKSSFKRKVLTKYMLVQRVLSVRSPAKELLSKIITAFRMIISILL